MRVIVLPSVLFALAGCASVADDPLALNKSDTVCERYYPTGSNLSSVRCTTAAERSQQQQKVNEMGEAVGRSHTTGSAPRGP